VDLDSDLERDEVEMGTGLQPRDKVTGEVAGDIEMVETFRNSDE